MIATHLDEVLDYVLGRAGLETYSPPVALQSAVVDFDMADIVGMEQGRRAVEVAVAGDHHLLLTGTPGVGKSMLGRRAAGVMPPLNDNEARAVTKIHGIAGNQGGLIRQRPCRMPHHTVSMAGLFGGGRPLRPGEVSLAHEGVLFLDELPEFQTACLDGLCHTMKRGVSSVVTTQEHSELPARFLLIAAMNPCPCGYNGHPSRACSCSNEARNRYLQRVSPLKPRFDLNVTLAPTPIGAPTLASSESSTTIHNRVRQAKARQAERYKGTPWRSNGDVPAAEADRFLSLTEAATTALAAVGDANLRHRVRRVARTIADLAPTDLAMIDLAEVNEALALCCPPQG